MTDDRGAPTGKYTTMPAHLEAPAFDLQTSGARLVVKRRDLPDVDLPIDKPELIIGRAVDGVDFALDDDMVSRRHAKLTVDERGYFKLEDLESKNGITYLGRPVRRLNLVNGDVFTIGGADFAFHVEARRYDMPEAAPPPEPKPREASIFADVEIPAPMILDDDDEDVGWRPEPPQVHTAAPTPPSSLEEAAEPEEEEDEAPEE